LEPDALNIAIAELQKATKNHFSDFISIMDSAEIKRQVHLKKNIKGEGA
jgi:hypothetical protein